MVETNEKTLEDKFRNEGMEVVVLDSDQLAPFKSKVAPLVGELKEKFGSEACEAFQIP